MSSPIKQSSVGSAGVWIVCCMSELVLCVVVVSWIGMCAVVRLRGSCVLLWRGLVSAVVVCGQGMFVEVGCGQWVKPSVGGDGSLWLSTGESSVSRRSWAGGLGYYSRLPLPGELRTSLRLFESVCSNDWSSFRGWI